MYIGGFVLAVKTAEKAAYLEAAAEAAAVFREYGATRVVECWGDDVPEGELTSFPMAVKRGPDETVLFSWIEFPDKATYESCMERSFSDPRMQMTEEMPMIMDPKRMIYGGFEAILDT